MRIFGLVIRTAKQQAKIDCDISNTNKQLADAAQHWMNQCSFLKLALEEVQDAVKGAMLP